MIPAHSLPPCAPARFYAPAQGMILHLQFPDVKVLLWQAKEVSSNRFEGRKPRKSHLIILITISMTVTAAAATVTEAEGST